MELCGHKKTASINRNWSRCQRRTEQHTMFQQQCVKTEPHDSHSVITFWRCCISADFITFDREILSGSSDKNKVTSLHLWTPHLFCLSSLFLYSSLRFWLHFVYTSHVLEECPPSTLESSTKAHDKYCSSNNGCAWLSKIYLVLTV